MTSRRASCPCCLHATRSYRFVSMHTNRDLDGGEAEEGDTLVKVHGFMVILSAFDPAQEPA